MRTLPKVKPGKPDRGCGRNTILYGLTASPVPAETGAVAGWFTISFTLTSASFKFDSSFGSVG